jgi:hypothetical protein
MMKSGEFKSMKENENPLSVDAKVFYLKENVSCDQCDLYKHN